MFEVSKGLLVLLVGFGLLSVVDQDLAQVAEDPVGHVHLNMGCVGTPLGRTVGSGKRDPLCAH